MAKKDWEEIQTKLQAVSSKLLEHFLDSDESFFPSETFKNPFLALQRTSLKIDIGVLTPLSSFLGYLYYTRVAS